MNQEKINILNIQTPEGIIFSLKLACPVTRFLAWTIDLAVVAAASTVMNQLLSLFGVISQDIAMAASILGYFVLSVGYPILLEWRWQGQTIGKRILKLRVMDEQGLHLQFSQIVIRNLVRFIDALPFFYLVGGVAALVSGKAQRLGDLAANTIVVWTPPVSEPDLDSVLSDKYNSFRDHPHLEARLRQRVSPHEAGIALQAMLRRDDLDPVARIELFGNLAEYFKSIVPFPQEVTDGISDERYIRNVVEVLFRKKTG